MTAKEWRGRPVRSLLSDKEEDRFTNYLCGLLQAHEVCQAFLRDLCGIALSAAEVATLTVRTQVKVLEGEGRADLIIRGPKVYLIIEAKVGAWLHDSQTTVYGREIEDWSRREPDATSGLYFLVPARSTPFLLEDARAQLVSLAIGVEPKLIRWEDIASLCKKLALTTQDPRLAVHLADFADLVECRIGPAQRPFTAEESLLLADPLVAQALAQARALTPRIVNLLPQTGPTGLQRAKDRGQRWDGFTLRREDRWWWIGFWPDMWAEIGVSPIVLQLPGLQHDHLDEVPKDLPAPMSSPLPNDPGFVVPLRLRPQLDLDLLAKEHAEVVRGYCLNVPQSGGIG